MFMARRISAQPTVVTKVTMAAIPAPSQIILPTKFRSPWVSFSPNFWATGIANPAQTPLHRPSTKKEMEPVEPTPARASMPRKLPTTTVSTME